MGRILAFLAAILLGASPALAEKRIALTFDDVPRGRGAFFTPDERTAKLIASLRRAGVRQAAFFVTPGNLVKPDGIGGERRIDAYVRAGHVIANHSFGHRPLSTTEPADYVADIDRAEAWLEGRRGRRPWFRFPFLNEGRADKARRNVVRTALKARGLRNAYVTVDGADWNLDALTAEAVKSGKAIDMAALRDLYVETMVEAAEYNDRLARRAIGRSPAHVMLLHEADVTALFLGDLVAALRKAGWTIVTVDKAYADPIGATVPDVPSAQGTLTEAIAWEKGLPAPRWYGRASPRIANPIFVERVLEERASSGR